MVVDNRLLDSIVQLPQIGDSGEWGTADASALESCICIMSAPCLHSEVQSVASRDTAGGQEVRCLATQNVVLGPGSKKGHRSTQIGQGARKTHKIKTPRIVSPCPISTRVTAGL